VFYDERPANDDEVDRSSEVEAGLRIVAERLAELHQAIETLREAEPLRADAAARLELYEHNERRLLWERDRLERERVELARGEDRGIGRVAASNALGK
jgi:hypothetical protein